MEAGLLAFGSGAVAAGIGLLVAARWLYPRFDASADVRRSLRLVTAVIAAILVVTGVALVTVGVVSPTG